MSQIDEASSINNATNADAIVLSSGESTEILEDIFLFYRGYTVSDFLDARESDKDSYVVYADVGKKLLVLNFSLYNKSDKYKHIEFTYMGPRFQIVLNGKIIGYSAVTFLPNDLTAYSGNIESRARKNVVLVTQISASEAANIESLGMVVTNNGMTTNYILQNQ